MPSKPARLKRRRNYADYASGSDEEESSASFDKGEERMEFCKFVTSRITE
jgi:hypothetical protein